MVKAIAKRRHFLIAVVCLVFFIQLVPIGKAIPTSLNVLYIGINHSDWKDRPVKAAIELDETFNLSLAETSDEFLDADISDIKVIVLQDIVLSDIAIQKLKVWVQSGNALIIFCGPRTSNNSSLFLELGIVSLLNGQNVRGSDSNAVPLLVDNSSSPIISGIDWKAMPDFKNYTIFENVSSDIVTLVQKQSREDSERKVDDPLVFYKNLGTGRVLVYSPWVESGFDIEFRGSAFFNYLVYSAVITRAGLDSEKKSFRDWEYAPVPHLRQQIMSMILIGATIIFTIWFTRRAREKSKIPLDAEALRFGTNNEKKENEKKENGASETADPAQERDQKKQQEKAEREKGWDTIGLHKQISGFFNSLFTAVLVAGPQIVLLLFIYPRYIMPFPQAAGVYSLVNDIFAAIWLFLDVGTSIALVTFFSAHRIERPEKAVHYIQIFVFWQLLSGICQFAVIGGLSLFYFPTVEKYSYLSYHFLVHSMIQFPGFLSVMVLTLRALQRSDLEQISILLVNFVFKLGVAFLCILLFRWVFRDSVVYGEIFGAIIGLNIGAWVGNFADFGFSYYLFRRAGYSGKFIFRWDFSKEEFIEVMKYGIRLVLGNVWVPAVQTLQALVITVYVFDYGSEIGYYNLALQIGQIIGLVGMFTDSLQAPIAEAWEYKVAHGKEKYLERVFVSSYKWVNILNFFLSSSLLVVGARLIIGFSGPTWARAAYFFIPVLIFQFLGPYSWIGDKFLLGCKMPTTIMWIWIAEQGIRAIGLLILVPMYGMAGVLYAYIPGLLTKNIALLIIIRKKITRPKMYYWQTWIAPAIAALINWFLLESFANWFWKMDLITSIGLFFIAVLGFINIYGFLTGFFGAWDENEMKELEFALKIGHKAINYFIFFVYHSARLAYIIKSPFIGKSKIDIWEQAQVEMEQLQQMKKKLTL